MAGEVYLRMKSYVLWAVRQIYHLFFRPSAFLGEADAETSKPRKLGLRVRASQTLKLLPWMVGLAACANVAGWLLAGAWGAPYAWGQSWVLVLVYAVMGAIAGLIGGLEIGMAMGGPGAAGAGVAGGLAAGLWPEGGMTVAHAVAVGVALGVAAPVWAGAERLGPSALAGALVGAAMVPLAGVVFGVWEGVREGLQSGVRQGGVAAVTAGGVFWVTYYRVAAYPVDAVLAAVTYMLARLGSRPAASVWRGCPVVWNEMIWLPLPFLRAMLGVLCSQDREFGFRQITFVAAERTLQRRAALGALVALKLQETDAGVGGEALSEARGFAWLGGLQLRTPEGSAELLARVDRLTARITQVGALHSAFRARQALRDTQRELEELQCLLVASAGFVAGFVLRGLNRNRGVLLARLEELNSMAEARREIANPFVLGSPVRETDTNVFTGRRDIVRQVEESELGAQTPPTLLLHGPRRMGKTSILYQLPRLLGPDFAPAALDCQNPAVTGSAATLLAYLSRVLSEGLSRRHVTVRPLSVEALEREPFAAFDRWLDRVERNMPETMRALLCLDEFERLREALSTEWGARFLDYLRHTIQHRPRVVLLFSGSHTFEELGPIWTDRFISARRVRVSFLKREDVIPLLTEPVPEFDMTYAPGALDAIIEATNCQPYLTQVVAFELVQYLNEQQRREASQDDVEVAISRALTSGGEYFANLWSDADEQGREILRAVAKGEAPPDFPEARARLREHDVVDDAGRFAVPMVERWVTENKV